MSAIGNKLANLTDIPLHLEQGDSPNRDATMDKADKTKSNSLKRFFRTAKNSMTTKRSSDDADCESELKNVRSLQLRFGSFHKNDDTEKTKSNTEASLSTEIAKLKPTESRLKLQARITSYWTAAFNKSSKKSATKENAQLDDKLTPPQNDIDKFENNQSANL